MLEADSFRFGVDFLPIWFKKLLKNKDVDYVYNIWGDVVACRFYDMNDREREIFKGKRIYKDMFYK